MRNVFLLCLTTFIFSGCVATQHDMLQLQSQMDDLNSSLATMQKNQADLAVKIDNLNRNLTAFSEDLKDVSARMDRFSSNLSRIDSNINTKVSGLGKRIEKQQKVMKEELLPAKIYSVAYSNLANKNYDGAISYFKKYIERFSDGEMLEGAYYNLAQAYYAKNKWKESAISYANLLDKYPNSFRVPSARLRYAKCLLKMGKKKEEAIKYLKSVIKDYPKTAEAKYARSELKKIGAPGTRKKPRRK